MVKNKSITLIFPLIALLFLVSCSGKDTITENTDIPIPTSLAVSPSPETTVEEEKRDKQTTAEVDVEVKEEEIVIDSKIIKADVISVDVNGSPNKYQFSVAILSPDTGCEQYADWWEVLDESGNLIYRRILMHSHVNEQPFTRSGGPVDLKEDTVVFIRAHMNQAGFGGNIMKGSAKSGFILIENPPVFPDSIEIEAPLPTGCNF